MLTLGTGVGGGLVLDGQLFRGWTEFGHIVIVETASRARAPARAAAISRRTGAAPRQTHGARAARARAPTRSSSRRRAVDPRAPSARHIGRHLGAGDQLARQHLRPELVVIGGGFGVAAGVRLSAGARGRCREALRPAASVDREAELGAMRASSAPGSSRSTRSAPTMPLAVCATPIGNLEDVTLRVCASCAEADLVLCEDTRHTRVLLDRHGIQAQLSQLPRAQRGGADGRARSRGSQAGERVALVSDAGLPGDQRSGRAADRGGARRRRGGDGAAGALRGRDGARRERARRASATSSSATCRAASRRSRRCGRSSRAGRGPWSRSSRRSGCRRRCARSRRRCRTRRSPSAAS